MNEHACLPASRSCRHHYALGFSVFDNLFLLQRQIAEQLSVFHWREVVLQFLLPFAVEVFLHKQAVVHLEIVLYVFQCGIIVSHHQVGIFAHDMYLLHFLFVEFIDRLVVFFFVAHAHLLESVDVHGIVEDKKSSLKFQSPCL